jgi:hypothetical protein
MDVDMEEIENILINTSIGDDIKCKIVEVETNDLDLIIQSIHHHNETLACELAISFFIQDRTFTCKRDILSKRFEINSILREFSWSYKIIIGDEIWE